MNIYLANFWVNVILAVITFLAVCVALFKQEFWNLINKPKIIFRVQNKAPHRIQGNMTNGRPIWYFRLEVRNIGKTIAKDCCIKINSVISEDGKLIEYFEPDRLKWSGAPRDMRYRENMLNTNQKDTSNLPPIFREHKNISPNGGWEFCDLFETIGDGGFTFLSTGGRPSYRIKECNYIVEVEVFGKNIKPKKIKFRLSSISDFPLIRIDRI